MIPNIGHLAIALIVGFGAGFYTQYKFGKADRVDAVQEVRKVERDVDTISNTAGTGHLDRLRKEKDDAESKLRVLRKRLAESDARCDVPVPPEWVRDPAGVPPAAGNPTGPQQPAPPVEAVADCRVVVESCEANRLEVCQPNASQLEDLQRWYRDLRDRVNGRGS